MSKYLSTSAHVIPVKGDWNSVAYRNYLRQRFVSDMRKVEATKGPLLVHVQCLVTSTGKYVIKEFSVESPGSNSAWIVIRPPSYMIPKMLESVHARYDNDLSWDDGLINTEEFLEMASRLFYKRRPIFVIGRHKAEVLQKLFRVPVIYIKELLPSLSIEELRILILTEKCPYHKLNFQIGCAKWHAEIIVRHCNFFDIIGCI